MRICCWRDLGLSVQVETTAVMLIASSWCRFQWEPIPSVLFFNKIAQIR